MTKRRKLHDALSKMGAIHCPLYTKVKKRESYKRTGVYFNPEEEVLTMIKSVANNLNVCEKDAVSMLLAEAKENEIYKCLV